MSSNFRPESQDGYPTLDRELHEYQEGVDGDYSGYDRYLDGADEDEPFDPFEDDSYGDDGETPDFDGDDDYDSQPSEYDEWMDFDPDC
jgi:hypothetical protein